MSYEVKKGGAYKPMVITKENAISTGRYLSRIDFRKTEKAKWLTLEVTDKDGGKARKSYFEPRMGGFIDTPEKLTKEQTKFNGVIQSLIKAILSDSYETGKIDSFEDFCLKIQHDIPESLFAKELRVKCIYDKTGNPTLPAFGVVFEDPIKVPLEKSKIKMSDRDIVVKVEMDKDALPETKTVEISTDDLPFN
jgi:hypothetical protein